MPLPYAVEEEIVLKAYAMIFTIGTTTKLILATYSSLIPKTFSPLVPNLNLLAPIYQ